MIPISAQGSTQTQTQTFTGKNNVITELILAKQILVKVDLLK
jgi:hypothetical protein